MYFIYVSCSHFYTLKDVKMGPVLTETFPIDDAMREDFGF